MAVTLNTPDKPFRFWCQKTLPLVYDDSLSYYELLCKVVDYLNKTMSDVRGLGEAYNTLESFVNDYFENLDVQEEINNKLDAMVASGQLQDMIDNYLVPFTAEIREAVTEQNAEIATIRSLVGSPLLATSLENMTDTNKIYVYTGSESGMVVGNWYYFNGTDWVSGGVYNSAAVETDTTLSVLGAAADAYYTGRVKKNTDSFIRTFYNVQNGFIDNSGNYVDNNSYTCTSNIPCSLVKGVRFKKALTARICLYDEEGTYLGRKEINEETGVFPIESGYYFRVWFDEEYTSLVGDDIEIIFNDGSEFFCNGYITTQGVFYFDGDYVCSDMIPTADIARVENNEATDINVVYYNADKTFSTEGVLETVANKNVKVSRDKPFCKIWKSSSAFKIVRRHTDSVVIFGDSWGDTDPLHTEYTKWPALLNTNTEYYVKNYCKNGATITGDSPNYNVNGNLEGQVQQFFTDNVTGVDIFIINGGLNDYRGSIQSGYVCVKLDDIISRLRAAYPAARIIYIANHQRMITADQVTYFNFIANYVRRISKAEGYTTFGWIPASSYIDDNAHPNDSGYMCLFTDILAILSGGSPKLISNSTEFSITSGSTLLATGTIIENWNNVGMPEYKIAVTVTNAGLGETLTYTVSSTVHNNLALCGAVAESIIANKAFASALVDGCYVETTPASLGSNNLCSGFELKIIAATTNSGLYRN